MLKEYPVKVDGSTKDIKMFNQEFKKLPCVNAVNKMHPYHPHGMNFSNLAVFPFIYLSPEMQLDMTRCKRSTLV